MKAVFKHDNLLWSMQTCPFTKDSCKLPPRNGSELQHCRHPQLPQLLRSLPAHTLDHLDWQWRHECSCLRLERRRTVSFVVQLIYVCNGTPMGTDASIAQSLPDLIAISRKHVDEAKLHQGRQVRGHELQEVTFAGQACAVRRKVCSTSCCAQCLHSICELIVRVSTLLSSSDWGSSHRNRTPGENKKGWGGVMSASPEPCLLLDSIPGLLLESVHELRAKATSNTTGT